VFFKTLVRRSTRLLRGHGYDDIGHESFDIIGLPSQKLAAIGFSPESGLESLEISFPERIKIVGIHTVLLDPLLTSGTCHNFRVRDSSVSYKPPRPCQELAWLTEMRSKNSHLLKACVQTLVI
jgi:hypothetical protein